MAFAGGRALAGGPLPEILALSRVELDFVAVLDDRRCNGCRECLPVCSPGGLLWVSSDRVLLVDPWACEGCGSCVTACPQGAVTLQSRAGL